MSRIKIVHAVDAAPDHMTTRLYEVGEVHEVGTELMPQWLAESLLTAHQPVPSAHTVAVSQDEHRHLPGRFFAEATEDAVTVLAGGIVVQTQPVQQLFHATQLDPRKRKVR